MIYTLIESLVVGIAVAVAMVVLLLGAQLIKALLVRRISVLDVVVGPDGKLSESKCWMHVGKGMAVYVMMKDAADGQPTLELQALLLTILVAHDFFKKLLVMKFGGPSTGTPATTTG